MAKTSWQGAVRLACLFASAGLSLACPIRGPSGTGVEPPDPVPALSPEAANRVAQLVNLYRGSLLLKPLTYNEVVAEVAQGHAEAMAAGRAPYSHAGLEDRLGRIAIRIRTQAMGENLAAVPRGTVSPLNRAVERWIASDAHRHTMEGCFELTGVGMAYSPNGVLYLSQVFVLRAPGQPTEARRGADLEMAGCREQ